MEIISLRKSIIKTLFNDITTKQEKPLSIDLAKQSSNSQASTLLEVWVRPILWKEVFIGENQRLCMVITLQSALYHHCTARDRV